MDCSLVPRRFKLGPWRTSIRSMLSADRYVDSEGSLAAVQEGGIVTGCRGVVKLSKSIGNYELGPLEVLSRRCRSMERSQDSSRAMLPAWDDSGSTRVASLGCSLRF